MASDIVPIRLSLTDGDLVTLWAPRWREDGEEWEAFLGDDESLFAFPEVAQLAAFVRTADDHDLIDHPAWSVVPDLTVAELTPDATRTFDLVGVPELAAEDADTWTVGELAEITEMVRSLAEVCDLDAITEILDSAPGFALLHEGTLPFVGREGNRLWTQMVTTIAERWDDVLDALDEMIDVPEVDGRALAAAEKEAVALAERADPDDLDPDDLDPDDLDPDDLDRELPADDLDADDLDGGRREDADEDGRAQPEPTFWEGIGIDPVRIVTADGDYVSLRCYLDDRPVFLGTDGTVEVFTDEQALATWIGEHGAEGHDLTATSTWPQVLARAEKDELVVEVDELNSYVLTGLDDDLRQGTTTVDAEQLELAAELVLDLGEWADDDEPREALADSEPLGWLVSFIVRPDPTRLAPSPPFDREVARWQELVTDLRARLHLN